MNEHLNPCHNKMVEIRDEMLKDCKYLADFLSSFNISSLDSLKLKQQIEE